MQNTITPAGLKGKIVCVAGYGLASRFEVVQAVDMGLGDWSLVGYWFNADGTRQNVPNTVIVPVELITVAP